MSLTSFLEIRDVREKFAEQFRKPRFTLKKGIAVPLNTERYRLVGTAFDYLLRFYLKRLNPEAVARQWVAESAPNSLAVLYYVASEVDGEVLVELDDVGGRSISIMDPSTGNIILSQAEFGEIELVNKINQIIETAKAVYNEYLSSGEITDSVIESALLLAQLDPIIRAGYIDENIGTLHSDDVAELRSLISVVDPDLFTAKELCMLNPTFGEASRLVSGADADLLIDDTLVDIKTTKNLRLLRRDFNQLVGYYILLRIGGVPDAPHPPTIERVGIYYARYAELYTVPIQRIVDNETLPSFIDWFEQRAVTEYSH